MNASGRALRSVRKNCTTMMCLLSWHLCVWWETPSHSLRLASSRPTTRVCTNSHRLRLRIVTRQSIYSKEWLDWTRHLSRKMSDTGSSMTEEKAVESLVSLAMRMVRGMTHWTSKLMPRQQVQVETETVLFKNLACQPLWIQSLTFDLTQIIVITCLCKQS